MEGIDKVMKPTTDRPPFVLLLCYTPLIGRWCTSNPGMGAGLDLDNITFIYGIGYPLRPQ